MKNISDFHYNSDGDFRYLGDFCIKRGTKIILTKPCKLGLSKKVIPEGTEVILIGEEPDGDKRKKVVIEIKGEKIEISTNIILDSELFREMIKLSSGKYKISKVTDTICNQVKLGLTKGKGKKKEEKHHHKEEHKHHIGKKEKGRLKDFFKKIGFSKQKD